ncbi:MAG: Na+:solute symporter [Salibacteraceae bacterium]|nr:Na+:solute symporter [Salibacteraceae bacterium]
MNDLFAMLATIDWIIIVSFLLLSLGIGLYYRQNAGKSISDFFLGGRNLPWYIAGISMVATTFAADTPLAVSELVSQGGIAKNWLWWSFIFGGALTTMFFATLWRRAGVLTELEFITLRYEGKPAHYLRLFKSVYLGLFINAIIIAWVNLAMMTLIEIFFDVSTTEAMFVTFGLMILAVIYATLSGLKGVAITDTVQFVIAMVGCIILAIITLNSDEVGGIENLKNHLPDGALAFVPSISQPSGNDLLQGFGLTIGAFLAFVGVQWWSSWYPGAEPGGGGYIAQRMMSTRSEKDAVWATLLFQVGHYCVRPWPWIIVGLCAIMLYSGTDSHPELKDALIAAQANGVSTSTAFMDQNAQFGSERELQVINYHYNPRMGFVFAMKDFLPNGLRGLLLVAFIAAYLSTISTQVNWGASYLVNDLIKPLNENFDEAKLVMWSRITSIIVMIVGAIVTPFVTSISGVWEFLMNCGAGLGLVLILRWYWYRINAWSEISATIAPLIAYAFCYFYLNDAMGASFVNQSGPFFFTVGFTTVIWIITTFVTASPSEAHLRMFIQRVKPQGIWPNMQQDQKALNSSLKHQAMSWFFMVVMVVSLLFGIGSLILQNFNATILYFVSAVFSIFGLRFFLKKTNIFERNSP